MKPNRRRMLRERTSIGISLAWDSQRRLLINALMERQLFGRERLSGPGAWRIVRDRRVRVRFPAHSGRYECPLFGMKGWTDLVARKRTFLRSAMGGKRTLKWVARFRLFGRIVGAAVKIRQPSRLDVVFRDGTNSFGTAVKA